MSISMSALHKEATVLYSDSVSLYLISTDQWVKNEKKKSGIAIVIALTFSCRGPMQNQIWNLTPKVQHIILECETDVQINLNWILHFERHHASTLHSHAKQFQINALPSSIARVQYVHGHIIFCKAQVQHPSTLYGLSTCSCVFLELYVCM